MKRLLTLVSTLVVAGCFDLTLSDPPPPPGSGSVQGTVVHAEPGQTILRPATGASIELVGSGVRTRATGETAAFNLTPVDTAVGSLLIRFDGDGDGLAEKQKLLRLEGLGTGRGKTVTLGQVVLGSNGAIRGRVLRGDIQGSSNHGGTSVFIPEGPFFGFTGDDGSFLLENLPEGRLTIAIFRAGYVAAAETVELRAGELFPLRSITLSPDPTSPRANLTGRVLLPEGTGAPDVTVSLSSGRTTTTDAEGRYAFSGVPYEVYSVGFVKSGYLTAELLNIIVASPTVTLRDVTLAPGMSTQPQLDAGRPTFDAGTPVDGGSMGGGAAGGGAAGGGAAGGAAAGGSAAGGSAAGGSAAGGSAAGGSAAGGSAAGGSAAGGSAAGGSAAGGSAAGGSAAGGAAAGGAAAGGAAAGGSAAGGSAAGGSAAGGSAGGAPVIDAGTDAGVDSGVPDAGPPPVAIIDAPPLVAPNALFTLSGQRSLGDRPLIFTWSQDAGPAIAIPNNGTQLAATPMLRAPVTPTLLKFNLSVSDPTGRASAPASVLIPVAVPPIAVIDGGFPALVYPSQRVVLSGAGSSDPNGSGITSYDWSVAPSFVTLTPLDGGLVQLDMPSMVGTPVVVTTQLSVVNGLLLRSPTVQASFQLTNVAAPSWSLDAGPSRTVGSGSIVTLSALATSPVPGANFVYDWSPASETTGDAGAPDWLLTDPNVANTTFIAPKVEGPAPRLITLTARATETTGVLSPSQRTASIVVSVIDRRAPQVIATSVVGGVQGISSGYVLFDEDIDPTTLSAVTVTPAVGSPNTVVVSKTAIGPRITFGLRPPASPGFMYTLNVAGVDDLAPAPANRMVSVAPIQFFPQVRWTPAWESTSTSTSEPWPGLAVRRPSPTGPVEVFVFGRKDGAAWFAQPFDVFSCATSPCPIADDVSAPTDPLVGPFVRGRRGQVVNSAPIASMQGSDFVGDAGVAWRWNGAWQRLPAHQGALFTVSPGTILSSTFVDDGGIKIANLDGGAWVPFSTVSTNTAQFWVGPTADPLLVASAPTSTGYYIAGRASSGLQSFIFASPSGSSFAVDGPLNSVTDVRPVLTSNGAGLNVVRFTNGTVSGTCWGAGTCGLNQYFTSTSAFDAIGAPGGNVFFAVASGGQLELYTLTGGQATPSRIPGPLRSGMPSTMLNADPACFADRPELFVLEGMLFITWQERCAPGPWRVYVRALD